MGAVKRHAGAAAEARQGKRTKVKGDKAQKGKVTTSKKSKKVQPESESEEEPSDFEGMDVDSDDDQAQLNDEFDLSDESGDEMPSVQSSSEDDSEDEEEEETKSSKNKKKAGKGEKGKDSNGTKEGEQEEKKESSNKSRESHAKQKALAQTRKASKPNADQIARSKQLWERLRRKSHVPKEERKKLVTELFEITTGRVNDFVFKHDSVRVIQTALKYANQSQRKSIATELQGEYRALAESRYAKFLIGKMLVHGDTDIRDMIVPEFYGHVRRLMRHPEASWIVDDIYRTVASKEQKKTLLREWYGPEFVRFQGGSAILADSVADTAELSEILAKHPEKRNSIMQYLHESINHLVQKKATGFTMLHDAMLQYFLNTKPGTTEATEFIELLKGDEEGDLLKNLAFTPAGSRVVCLALAYANAKDRKLLLRVYKDLIKMLAGDAVAHVVLLAAYELIDDTKLTAKSIFPQLLNQASSEEERNEELLLQVNDLVARIPILYLFAEDHPKWLLPETDHPIIDEIRAIRSETSKKDPEVRQKELKKAAVPTLLQYISDDAERLVQTTMGSRFISEVLLGAFIESDEEKELRQKALAAVAATTTSTEVTTDNSQDENAEAIPVMQTPFVGRMLKALVQGGRFDPKTKSVAKVQPPMGFAGTLYEAIQGDIMKWATEINPFVVVALVEAGKDEFAGWSKLMQTLKKKENLKVFQKLAKEAEAAAGDKNGKKKKDQKRSPAASAAKILLPQLS
ncbi:pumilio domain member 6 [Ascosphaera atra]|nr:pumilio domain member 6 [Ascosphaera atra]